MLAPVAAILGLSSSMVLERPLEKAIAFALEQRFEAFEVWADHPHAHPDETRPETRKELRARLREFVRVSLHGPLGNASLASINPGIWRESVRQYLATVELAHDLGATVVVIHPGDLRDHRFKDEFLRLSCEALARVADRAAQLGVTVAVENCGPYHAGVDQTTADLAAIVRSLGTRGRLCIDTGHAAVNKNAGEILSTLGEAIAHVHIHDNHGARDEHLAIGAGTIDFSPYVPLLRQLDGMAIAEVVWDGARSPQSPEELARVTHEAWAALMDEKL